MQFIRVINAEDAKEIICKITNEAIEKGQTKATIQKRLIYAIEKLDGLTIPSTMWEPEKR